MIYEQLKDLQPGDFKCAFAVIYELHVGTFTCVGRFEAVIGVCSTRDRSLLLESRVGNVGQRLFLG